MMVNESMCGGVAAGSKPTARRKSNQLKWFKKWDTMDLNAFSAFDFQ
jgi:hypothetical protein